MFLKTILLTALQIAEPTVTSTDEVRPKKVKAQLISSVKHSELQKENALFSDANEGYKNESIVASGKKDTQSRNLRVLLYGGMGYGPGIGLGIRTFTSKNMSLEFNIEGSWAVRASGLVYACTKHFYAGGGIGLQKELDIFSGYSSPYPILPIKIGFQNRWLFTDFGVNFCINGYSDSSAIEPSVRCGFSF